MKFVKVFDFFHCGYITLKSFFYVLKYYVVTRKIPVGQMIGHSKPYFSTTLSNGIRSIFTIMKPMDIDGTKKGRDHSWQSCMQVSGAHIELSKIWLQKWWISMQERQLRMNAI